MKICYLFAFVIANANEFDQVWTRAKFSNGGPPSFQGWEPFNLKTNTLIKNSMQYFPWPQIFVDIHDVSVYIPTKYWAEKDLY